MESGYKILWTDHALKELDAAYGYLQENFTEKELHKLSIEIDRILNLISKNPTLFPISESQKIRKVPVRKFNTIYYRERKNTIQILSFFLNRQNPDNKKI
ncbi:MAG: hypothetical protein WD048_11540 [Chitinophagales bacterium]